MKIFRQIGTFTLIRYLYCMCSCFIELRYIKIKHRQLDKRDHINHFYELACWYNDDDNFIVYMFKFAEINTFSNNNTICRTQSWTSIKIHLSLQSSVQLKFFSIDWLRFMIDLCFITILINIHNRMASNHYNQQWFMYLYWSQ